MDDSQIELEKLFDDYLRVNRIGNRLDNSYLEPSIQNWLNSIKKVGQEWINTWANSRQTKAKGTMPYVHLDFIESLKINACAFESDGYGFIGINLGILLLLNDFFNRLLANTNILKNVGDPSSEIIITEPLPYISKGSNSYIQEYSSNSIKGNIVPQDPTREEYAIILLQIAIRFLVAHELAHIRYGHYQLINTQFGEPFISEVSFLNDVERSMLTVQALEMDADSWATVQGMTILKGLISKINNMSISWDKYNNPIIGGMFTWIIAVYTLFRLFDQDNRQVGDLTTNHPHPALRQTMIMETIYSYLERELEEKSIEHYLEILPDCVNQIEEAISILTHQNTDKSKIKEALGPKGDKHWHQIMNQWKTVVRPQLVPLTYATDLVP